MSDNLANFILAARSLLTPWLFATVFTILVGIAGYYAYLDKRDREQAQREAEDRGEFAPTPYLGAATQEARRRLHGGDA